MAILLCRELYLAGRTFVGASFWQQPKVIVDADILLTRRQRRA
jgi:hypothetical protein